MEKKQNVPALRFRGFSGKWKNIRIEDIARTAYGGGTPSTRNADFWRGAIPWIQSSDVIEDELWSISPRKYISKEAVKYSAAKVIPKNSIAIITRVGVGKVAFLPFDYATSQDFLSLSRLKIDERFGTYAVWKKINADAGLVQGTSIKGITREEVLAKFIKVPVAENEAKQVGSFFYQFDKKIGETKRKIQKLRQFRQAMLTKLFPREGAAEPELRFRGFSGKWKSQKMKDLGSFLKGKLYSKKNIQTSGVPLILYGRLYTQYELVIDEVDTFAVPYENSVWSIGGEVIVPASGETAEDIAIASVVKRKGILLGGDLNIIRPNDTVSSVFLALSISYGHIHNELAKRAQGKSIVHIHNSDLVQLDIRLPSIEEQKAIGDFFYKLDRYISLQQKKLERMQRLKAALLEKLFV